MAVKNACSSVAGAIPRLELVSRLEREQPAGMEDPHPLGERLGLDQVMGAQQDRGVMLGPYVGDELLDLALGARVKAGRRLVEQQQHR